MWSGAPDLAKLERVLDTLHEVSDDAHLLDAAGNWYESVTFGELRELVVAVKSINEQIIADLLAKRSDFIELGAAALPEHADEYNNEELAEMVIDAVVYT